MVQKVIKSIKLNSELREVTRNSTISLTIKVVGTVIGFILSIFLGRKLGVEGLGILNLANKISGLLVTFGILGIGSVLVKEIAIAGDRNNNLHIKSLAKNSIGLGIASSIFLSVLVISMSESLSTEFFQILDLKLPLILICVSVIPQIVNKIYVSILTGREKIWQSNLLDQTLSTLLTTILVILLHLFFEINVLLAALSYLIARILALSVSRYLWSKDPAYHEVTPSTHSKVASLLKKGFPLLVANSSAIIASNLDVIIIGTFCDARQVGLYSVASRTAFISSILRKVVNSSIAAKIATHYTNRKIELIQNILNKSAKFLTLLGLAPIPVVYFFGTMFLSIWGEDFKNAYAILLTLFINQFFSLTKGPAGLVLTMCNQEKALGVIKLLEVIANLMITCLLTIKYGAFGAALGTTISNATSGLVMVFVVKKRLGLNTTVLKFK